VSALIVALIMVCIGAICLRRALSRDWRPNEQDRRAFLLFCGVFGAGSILQGSATRGDVLLLSTRIIAGLLLLIGAAIVTKRVR
jgi:hypothetical protein